MAASHRFRREMGPLATLRKLITWDTEWIVEHRRERRRQLARPDGLAFIDLGLDREGCKALERAMMGWEEIR